MKKIFVILFVLFLFTLAGCNQEIKYEKYIKFEITNSYSKKILKEECEIISSHEELRDTIDVLYLSGGITQFDYTKNALILLSYEKSNEKQNIIPVGVKIVDDTLIVEVYVEENGDIGSLFESYAIKVSAKEVAGVEKTMVMENNDDYCKVTLDYYRGGCILRYTEEYVRKGKEKVINNKFLDLETLTIYENVVQVDHEMYLCYYDKNGIYGARIKEYIMKNNEYEFESGFTTLESIQTYNIVEENDNFIIIDYQNVKYTFKKAFDYEDKKFISLYSIESNKLFNKEYQEAKNILSILYNNDTEFINDYISVALKEDSYKLVFNDYPVFG